MIARRMSSALGLAAVLLAVACGGNVVGPDNQLQVSNNTDNFQFQVSTLNNVKQTFTYQWTNTGTTANVNKSCSISGGSASLTIEDAAGTQVFSGDLAVNGTVTTTAGTAGTWTITVEMKGVSGALNFRVQTP